MKTSSSLAGKTSLLWFAACALAACGGGGGGDGGSSNSTYSVGGMVSGLVGSGLMLANGGDSLPISANAQFTFGTQMTTGVGYNVAISTQPTNPTQNCVVTNGSGTIGSSNVTNVSVVCTTPNLATARLAGTYKVVSFEHPSPFDYGYSGDFSDLLTLTFDGAGNFSGSDVQAGDGTVVSGAMSGTYTVTTAGTFTLSPMGGSTISGSVSVDGNTLVAAQTASGVEPSLVFGIKQGQTHFSNANLTGTYTTVRFGYHSAGDSSALSTLTFDGAGNFSGSDAINNAGTVSSAAVAGTYTVAADGTLTLSPAGGSPATGGLSADGNTLVTSRTIAGVLPEILVGIKQGQTDFSNANLAGTYAVAAYGYDGTADISALSDVAFDGTGNFDATGVQNQGGTVSSSAALGTYLVAADGTLTVTPMDSYPVSGGLGADGTTFVITQMTAAHLPQVLLGVESALPALSADSIKITCVETAASTRAVYMCPQAVETLKNTGTSTLYLFALSVAGQFAQTGTCGPSLSPGQTCTITVRYSGPTSITAPNLRQDTTYSGSLSVEAGVSATPASAVTQKVPLQAVLPKASG